MSGRSEGQLRRLLRLEAAMGGTLTEPDYGILQALSRSWFVLWDDLVQAGGGSGVVRAVVAGIRDPRAMRRLAAFVEQSRGDLLLRESAVVALARSGAPEAEDLLLGWYESFRPLRRVLARELARLDTPWAQVALRAELTERDPASVPAAAALARRGDSEAVRVLRGLLEDFADQGAAKALGELSIASAVPGLLALLHSEEMSARETAVLALGEIGDPRGLPAVIGVIDDPEPELRLVAVGVLWHVTGQSPWELTGTTDPEEFVRQARQWWRGARRGLVRRVGYQGGAPRHLGHWIELLEASWRSALGPERDDARAARLEAVSGQRFDFDAYRLDTDANVAALRQWREWWRQNASRFPAGVWYWQGERLAEPTRWP